MTTGSEYLLTEAQCLLICMFADGNEAKNAEAMRKDMVKVLMAWRRGKLLPRWEVPTLAGLLDDFNTPDA
jgi:hypothetical protein